MKTVKEICDYHIEDPDLIAREDKTYCNVFVQRVCLDYGYAGLKDRTANSIYDFCSNSEDFVKIGMDDAYKYSTDGMLCIAALKSTPHGHVAIVYPDLKVFSGKWNMEVPRVASVGTKNGIMGVNYAFKDKPDYFLLRG